MCTAPKEGCSRLSSGFHTGILVQARTCTHMDIYMHLKKNNKTSNPVLTFTEPWWEIISPLMNNCRMHIGVGVKEASCYA